MRTINFQISDRVFNIIRLKPGWATANQIGQNLRLQLREEALQRHMDAFATTTTVQKQTEAEAAIDAERAALEGIIDTD